jgi:hypothetical protein
MLSRLCKLVNKVVNFVETMLVMAVIFEARVPRSSQESFIVDAALEARRRVGVCIARAASNGSSLLPAEEGDCYSTWPSLHYQLCVWEAAHWAIDFCRCDGFSSAQE